MMKNIIILLVLFLAATSCGTLVEGTIWDDKQVPKLPHKKFSEIKDDTRSKYLEIHGHRKVAIWFGDKNKYWQQNTVYYTKKRNIGVWTMNQAWELTKNMPVERDIYFWYLTSEFQ